MSGLQRPVFAGLAGAAAYLAAQEIDRRIVNPRSNDLLLLGGMVTSNERLWRPLGLLMHFAAGATFGLLFQRVAAPRLPGPYWLRGLMLAQFENATLWPLVLLLDRTHVAVKRGDLAPMNQPMYFVQAVWRHLALGVVIGALLSPADTEESVPSQSS
ncbi:MAG: hypothetical protein AB7P40_28250 [Chloroflexota bacterium]